MPRLTRVNQKVFASQATNNGVFGSLQANNPQTSNDVAVLQSLPAFLTGWDDAIEQGDKLPPLEEFQGIQYAISYQQAYMLQEGIAEWNVDTTYYKGSFCKTISGSSFKLYCSLTDNNVGNVVTNTTHWKKVMDSDDLYTLQSTTTALQNSLNTKVPASIGSGIKPVYTNANGVITASNSTVGWAAQPVYMNGGTITQCSSTVGSETQPVYMNGGTITVCKKAMGVPNWWGAYNILGSNGTFNVPALGYIYVQTLGSGLGDRGFFDGTINGISIYSGGDFGYNHETDTNLYPVDVGDTVVRNNGYNTTIKFIPCK